MKARFACWWEATRPFTLAPPAIGMVSGGLSALGANPTLSADGRFWTSVGIGALMAAALNAASNVLNQIHDLALDRVNKPERPIPSGRLSVGEAYGLAVACYAIALVLAFIPRPSGFPETGVIVLVTTVLTWVYSAPPVRARNSWWLGPLVIAVPRGLLLKVAGWSCIAPVGSDREPWILGAVFFVYVIGAAPVKDFADLEGDRRGGASSLPIRFGPKRAADIVAAFLLLPGLLLAVLPRIVVDGRPLLGVSATGSAIAGLLIFLHGARVGAMMRRDPDALVAGGGTDAWRHMYLLMMELQIAAAGLYFLHHL